MENERFTRKGKDGKAEQSQTAKATPPTASMHMNT